MNRLIPGLSAIYGSEREKKMNALAAYFSAEAGRTRNIAKELTSWLR